MIGTSQMKKPKTQIDPAAQVMRAVRKAEADALSQKRSDIRDAVEDTGTGFTILKYRKKPIEILSDKGKISSIELGAADGISRAYYLIVSRLKIGGMTLDRVDCSRPTEEERLKRLKRDAARIELYQGFANIWTKRNKDYGDPTLEIVIDAVIYEMSLNAIWSKHGYRLARIEKALIGGLRDYAARAGFVTGHQASQWMDEAEAVFGPQVPELRKAVRRAAVEK